MDQNRYDEEIRDWVQQLIDFFDHGSPRPAESRWAKKPSV